MGNRKPGDRREWWSARTRGVTNGVAVAVVGVLAIAAVALSVVAVSNDQRLQERGTADRTSAPRPADRPRADGAAAAQAEWLAQTLPVTRPGDRPLNVAFYGDSITVGWHASTETTSYRGVMLSTLRQGGDVVETTQAYPGATIGDILRSSTPVTGADISIVALGLNDLWRQVPAEQSHDEYSRLLAGIRNASPETGLICLGLFAASGAPLEDGLQERCTDAGGVFVPLDRIWADDGSREEGLATVFGGGSSDLGHPVDVGMAAIAYRALERIPGVVGVVAPPAGLVPSDPSLRP